MTVPMLLATHSSDGASVAVFAILCFTALQIVRSVTGCAKRRPPTQERGSFPAAAPAVSREEAALIENLHRTIAQMETRIEALETILIEQRHKKENSL